MLTTLLLLLRAAAACDVEPAAWASGVDDALAAWRTRDTAALVAAEARARADVPCLTGPIDPEAAARFHLVVGLVRATTGRDRAGALRELQALPPTWRAPEGVAPEGQFLAALLTEAQATPARARLPVPLSPDQTLLVDGRPAADRPDGAAVLQALLPGARVAWSALDAPPPGLATIAAAEPAPGSVAPPGGPDSVEPSESPTLPTATTSPAPRPLAPPIATALAALVGGGAVALGLANRAAFDDPETANEDLVRRQQTSVGYTAVAAVAGSATLALGAWWVVRW